jgi:hypothetical protein
VYESSKGMMGTCSLKRAAGHLGACPRYAGVCLCTLEGLWVGICVWVLQGMNSASTFFLVHQACTIQSRLGNMVTHKYSHACLRMCPQGACLAAHFHQRELKWTEIMLVYEVCMLCGQFGSYEHACSLQEDTSALGCTGWYASSHSRNEKPSELSSS